jgi:hypothetical protein
MYQRYSRIRKKVLIHPSVSAQGWVCLTFDSQNSRTSENPVTPISLLSPVFSEIRLGTRLHCSWHERTANDERDAS